MHSNEYYSESSTEAGTHLSMPLIKVSQKLLRGALCISMYVTGTVCSCDTVQVFLCTKGTAVVILLSR